MGRDNSTVSLSPTLQLQILFFLVLAPAAYLVVAIVMVTKKHLALQPNPLMFYGLLAFSVLDIALVPIVERFQIRAWRKASPRNPLPMQIQTVTTTKMALMESHYLFGLVLLLATGDYHPMYYFYALGILASILYWPTRARLDELARKMEAP